MLGVVVHVCNPNNWGGGTVRRQRQDKFEVRLVGKVGSRPTNDIQGACLRNTLSPQKTHH